MILGFLENFTYSEDIRIGTTLTFHHSYMLCILLSRHHIIIPYKEALFVSSCKKVPCVCLIKVIQFPVRNDCYSHCWVEGHHSEGTGHGQSWGQWSLPLLDPGSALPGSFTLTFTTTYCKDNMKFVKSLHGKCSISLGYFQIIILNSPAFCSKPKCRDVQILVIPLAPN